MACCSFRNPASSTVCCAGGGCDKTCVEVKKVFDACVQQRNVTASLTVDFGQGTPVNVVSVTSSGDATVSDLTITPIVGCPGSRVSFTVTAPVTVEATDQSGTTVTGTSSISFEQDLVMRVPQEGLISPEVERTGILNGLQNTLSGNVVTTNACVTIITKVVADVLLVVPSYGYLALCPAQEYTQEACGTAFSAPIFPR
ncbi:MAG: hypothetical protein J5781_08495 [Clostridia bacterium]|nr:hypothetical protein [Clostridia bacterium]